VVRDRTSFLSFRNRRTSALRVVGTTSASAEEALYRFILPTMVVAAVPELGFFGSTNRCFLTNSLSNPIVYVVPPVDEITHVWFALASWDWPVL
jgi:hypothetical protein